MKPKLLVLCPRYPYPVVGGDRLRIYRVCSELSKHYRLHLLSFVDVNPKKHPIAPHDKVFDFVDVVYRPKWRSALSALLAIFSTDPLQVAYYRDNAFMAKVRKLARQSDAVLFHLIRMAPYTRNLPNPIIGEFTDAISLNYERGARSRTQRASWLRWLFELEARRLLPYERKAAELSRVACFVSHADVTHLFPDGAPPHVIVASNGVDTEKLRPDDYLEESEIILFIGNLQSKQNFAAAEWFSRDVMPLLRPRGNFEFMIVGRITEAARKRLESYANVHVTGEVESIEPYARQCFAAVCPVHIGAGVQNKVLEYLALGIPTVTTTIGHEGLELTPGRDLLIADTPIEYVEALCLLKSDRSLARRLREYGRATLVKGYSWESRLAPLQFAVKKLVDSARETMR